MWAQVLFYKGDAPNALRPLTSVLSVHRFVAASAVDGLRGLLICALASSSVSGPLPNSGSAVRQTEETLKLQLHILIKSQLNLSPLRAVDA